MGKQLSVPVLYEGGIVSSWQALALGSQPWCRVPPSRALISR